MEVKDEVSDLWRGEEIIIHELKLERLICDFHSSSNKDLKLSDHL